ncbi:MAG: 16S rRNA (cytosine(1402)-N(4))-methyltransferase RsmH [Patescibacteria group bacterium]
MEYKHTPVMLEEILAYLDPKLGENYIDCTLGGGGYSKAILDRIGDKGKVLAIDMDNLAIENAKINFKTEIKKKSIILVNNNFKNLQAIVNDHFEIGTKFDGIIFDLGLSSAQIQDRTRGFSFQLAEAPLNMAFSQDAVISASSIINEYSEDELIKIFENYGEEKNSRHIAREIVRIRQEDSIKTVGQLLALINKTINQSRRASRIHPATKIFQALRIAVNDELENLKQVLPQSIELLNNKGKIITVTFHSLEDRIVKQFFKQESRDCLCLPIHPVCQCNHRARLKILTPKVIKPTEEEILINPRARSAKLRVAEVS